MENATKALLIAAGVLIGIMILSLGVTLFAELSSYVENAHDTIRENENREFNAKFLSCIRDDLTVHDIISIANFAHENNMYYGLDPTDSGNLTTYYVNVLWENHGKPGIPGSIALDEQSTDDIIWQLQDTIGDTYRCDPEDVQISNVTGRVFRITFTKNPK